MLQASATLRPWLMVLSVAGATILPSYLTGALTAALPSIGSEIGLEPAELQWPLTVLSLVNGAFLLVTGGIADSFGRRYAFFGGTAWLLVFSLFLAFIRDSTAFIALSAVMGLGPALLTPAGTGILGESLPQSKFRNGAFATLGAGQPLGFIIGLIFGGLFGHKYEVIYCINAAAAALFGALASTCLPRDGEMVILSTAFSNEDHEHIGVPRRAAPLMAFDWTGAVLSTVGLILLTLGVAFAGTDKRGWASIPVLVMLPIAVILLILFFVWEMHQQRQSSSYEQGQSEPDRALKAPLIPPGLWRAPRFTMTLVVVFFSWLSFNALTYFCTLFYQEVQKVEPIQSSIRFLPMVGMGISLNVLGGILVARVDALWLIVSGSIGGLGASILFSLTSPEWAYGKSMLFVMILIVSPDMFFSASQLFACQTVGPRRAALAGSLFNITIRLATSIGLAATGSIASSVTQQFSSAHPTARHTEALLAGYRAAGWFCTGCSAFSIILSFLFLGKMGVVGKTDEQTRDTSPRPTLSDSTRQLNGTSLNATPRRSTEQNSLNDIPMEHLDRKK